MIIASYKIVAAESTIDLNMRVAYSIESGWQPFGAPQIPACGPGARPEFYQAMVMYEKPQYPPTAGSGLPGIK